MTAQELFATLRAQANPANVAGMARYGINTGRDAGHSDAGAARAWPRGRARSCAGHGILGLRAFTKRAFWRVWWTDPARMTRREAERWVRDFDSWDVCDQACRQSLPVYAVCHGEGGGVGARPSGSYVGGPAFR